MITVLTYTAIICGGLLTLILLAGILGGIDLDTDLDAPDADGGVGGVGIVKGGLTFFSIGSWTARVMLLSSANPWLSILLGAAAGAVAVGLLSLLLKFLLDQEENVNFTAEDAVRQSGKVYLRIPATGRGIVHVHVRGGMREFPARSQDREEIPTGTEIEVAHLGSDGVLEVRPLHPAAAQKE